MGLVVLDETCMRCKALPPIPQISVRQGVSCETVVVEWVNSAQIAGTAGYKLEYGPSAD